MVKDELTAKAEKILAAQNGKNTLTLAELEQRVGKTISAKTRAQLEAVISGIRELLDGSTVDGDADDDSLLGQALEMDSIPMAKEKDSNDPPPPDGRRRAGAARRVRAARPPGHRRVVVRPTEPGHLPGHRKRPSNRTPQANE